jgi:hypothetical protein
MLKIPFSKLRAIYSADGILTPFLVCMGGSLLE